MEKALNSILLNNAGIYAAVSGRISPLKRDEDFPAITYEKGSRTESLDAAGRGNGIITSDFSITSRAKTYQEAKTIADLITAALKQLRGTLYGKDVLLTVQEDEGVNQLFDPEITEVNLDYTFYHR